MKLSKIRRYSIKKWFCFKVLRHFQDYLLSSDKACSPFYHYTRDILQVYFSILSQDDPFLKKVVNFFHDRLPRVALLIWDVAAIFFHKSIGNIATVRCNCFQGWL